MTFGFTFYFALELLFSGEHSQPPKKIQRLVTILTAVVSLQIIYGAFVAGLHAGRIYNTFPLMDGKIVPDGLFFLSPSWLNFFDNLTMVQFIHRLLAGVIFILACILYYSSMKNKINGIQKKGIIFFEITVGIQIILGIFTLITSVNIPLAVLHQSGAFLLFSACIFLLFVFRNSSIVETT